MCLLVAGLLSGCGGGPGGGGSGGSVQVLGISFLVVGVETTLPPFEDLTAQPASLGAPLDTAVVFTFDGVPSGPFNAQTLPVFALAEDVTPLANALPGNTVHAKGSYELDGERVIFRPFVPTQPIELSLSAPPATVPGLLPGSVYTASVSATPGNKMPNLKGPGASVKFGTTSVPELWYPGGPGALDPPQLVSVDPPAGTVGFDVQPFTHEPYDGLFGSYPAGPASFLLHYDRPLMPTKDNLYGTDLDHDGVVEPTFALRAASTRWLVGQTVPAGSTIGNAEPFPALAALTAGISPSADGSQVFLHDGLVLPDPTAALLSSPKALAIGPRGSLLFALVEDSAGIDHLIAIDHVLGEATGARVSDAVRIPDVMIDGVLVTPDLDCLSSVPGGRLLAYETGTRRLLEIRADVVRSLPHGPPMLASVSLYDEADPTTHALFLGAPLDPGVELRDLAPASDGSLLALAEMPPGASTTTLVALGPVDADLDGVFEASDGAVLAAPAGLELPDVYASFVIEPDGMLLALNRTSDTIDRVDPTTGAATPVLVDVSGYGVLPAPDGLAPATAFTAAWLDLDVDVTLLTNEPNGATVQLDPVGVLPFGARLDVVQRHGLAAQGGLSAVVVDGAPPLGVSVLSHVTTAVPSAGGDAAVPVHDVFLEDFENDAMADPLPGDMVTLAQWAVSSQGAAGTLRASVGVPDVGHLGDFRPLPDGGFNPNGAFIPGSNSIGFRFVFLDTDAQIFPLPAGGTPGIVEPTTVHGGQFTFRDIVIPEGVWVIARGSNPLRLTATGRVEISGILDVSGSDGLGDDTFDTGFLPVPGGIGGAGGGRGGDAHPTRFDPSWQGALDQYVTPETGEQGWGPVVSSTGAVSFAQVGGHGGLSTVGYIPKKPDNPNATSHMFPKVPTWGVNNKEQHRPPGGGGGSFLFHGDAAVRGSGDYLVQSESTWYPFTRCPTNDGIEDTAYGNEEHLVQGIVPNHPLQCVYRTHLFHQPGGAPGDDVFTDGDPSNDFIGPEGELSVLIGGQGGGGGGTRVDSVDKAHWSPNSFGTPLMGAGTPPHYPLLFSGIYLSPTLYDGKGGGGGGGGGSVQIRSFGDIVITKTGKINASGGDGKGGEVVKNSSLAGGGGGGSGGAVLLQAGGEVILRADVAHVTPWWDDGDGDRGASIDVSGGFGCDARTSPKYNFSLSSLTYDVTRSDGGQGGFGLIQLQEGTADGMPTVEQGAFVFARKRSMLKLGDWLGSTFNNKQQEHAAWSGNKPPPDELRYIDMLHWRSFAYGSSGAAHWFLLHGANPPLTQEAVGGAVQPHQLDTEMLWWDEHERWLVREQEPERVFESYLGWNPATFQEYEVQVGNKMIPGTLYSEEDEIPFSIHLNEPDGTPRMVEIEGDLVFDPDNVIDRLPVVHPTLAPPPFGAVSRGTSIWLDFNGAALRRRDADGLSPPFLAGFHGTHAGTGAVVTHSNVAGLPAHWVANTPGAPFDPGLVVDNSPTSLPFNDVAVHAPEYTLLNAVTNNAQVSVHFQGAFGVRAGSRVPDPDTLTAWVADSSGLSGYPLVRFRVTFALDQDPQFPFGTESMRPAVDDLRLRLEY